MTIFRYLIKEVIGGYFSLKSLFLSMRKNIEVFLGGVRWSRLVQPAGCSPSQVTVYQISRTLFFSHNKPAGTVFSVKFQTSERALRVGHVSLELENRMFWLLQLLKLVVYPPLVSFKAV